MSFDGANINKLNGGLSRSTTSDRVIVLVAGMTLPAGMVVNTAYELYDVTTAEDLGITATLDDTNNELIHYQLSEFFRLAPESKVWLIPVAKTKTAATLVVDADFVAALKNIDSRNVIAVCGCATPVASALADAVSLQGLINTLATEHILIDGIIVEGVGGDTASPLAIAAYPDLRSITAPNVSYMIGQDPYVAALKTAYALSAGIGAVLANVAVRRVHEDLGSVAVEAPPRTRRGEENFSLSDDTYWLSASLSDGKIVKSLSMAEQKALTAKGYMYVGSFPEYGGFYLNGCPTAVSKASDYAYFNFNCIWNKAARLIRATLIPLVRSKVPKEETTGYIKSTWIASAEAWVTARITENMISTGNIDAFDIYINPAQTVNEDTPMAVKARCQVGDIVHEFDVDLGLTNKL
jgi:hypothetical protein